MKRFKGLIWIFFKKQTKKKNNLFQHVTFTDSYYVIMMYLGGNGLLLAAFHCFVICVLVEMYLIICKYTNVYLYNFLVRSMDFCGFK